MAQAGDPRTLRFCYLDCEDAEKWAGHEQGAQRMLQPGAQWEHFKCYNQELPRLEDLPERFDGVVISGSHYSAYEDRQWICELEEWLQQAVAQHPHVRFLGMCFGHQILAKALGGRVGKNPSGKFVLGIEQIWLRHALQRSTAMQLAAADISTGGASAYCGQQEGDDSSPGSLRLIESHGDCVLALPPGAILLAESSTADVEMWTVAAGNVLAVQGHAELTAAETLEKIHGAVTAAGRLSAEEAEASARSLREERDDARLVLQLYRRFMEHGLPDAASAADYFSRQAAAAAAPKAADTHASGAVSALAAAPGSGRAAEETAVPAEQDITREALSASSAAAAPVSANAGNTAVAGQRGAAVPAGPAAARAAANMLQQLQAAVGAELGKAVAEQQLLRHCNEAAAVQYQQLGDAAAAARERAQQVPPEVRKQQEARHPSSQRLLDDLEAQVAALEETLVQLDTSSQGLRSRITPLSVGNVAGSGKCAL